MRANTSWNNLVEAYTHRIWPSDETGPFREARRASEKFQKTQISLSSVEARMMSFLIHQNKCRKFIEIGTLTGYSALWILKALPSDGQLWTFEIDDRHASAAREVLAFDPRARVVQGDAEVELRTIEALGPFDGIFIDGNKAAYGRYLQWAEKHLCSGALILADNVYLGGSVLGGGDGWGSPKQIEIMNQFNARLADPQLYASCLIPTDEGLLAAVKL